MKFTPRPLFLFLGAMLLIQFVNGFADAPIGIPTTEELTTSSEHIIIGKIQDSYCDYSSDQTQIFTFTWVEVDSALKGGFAAGELFLLRQLGGKVGDTVMAVRTEPAFAPDQEVLLFVNFLEIGNDGNSLYTITGINLGAYTIIYNTAFEQVVFHEDAWDLKQASTADSPQALQGLLQPLDDFISEIESYVR
jgi:hypothetical protein